MIKINLLPFRAARKKENIKRQISVYVLSVLLLVCLMVLGFLRLNGTLNQVRAEKARKAKELAKYKDTNRQLAKIKKRIKQIKAKLQVIRSLEKDKIGPVQLLDEIAMAVPRDKLWLRSLKEHKGKLSLVGTAMDNETVALFMNNLEATPHIKTVDLKRTKLKVLKKYKLSLTDFELDCKTYAYKEKRKVRPGKSKGRKGSRRRR
ncbi:MAG: PilN domain-containing protein [Deltaproteobacteria bacterium]|nr:PilN domain-containing protein [Deltaproteobacteria bacterium]MBW1927593.1 PilN domain-containing protein [Deltaproteobacteria bacterium]MBW2024618.1 PilN domain-containing protein [Deltaproteobacteria bacterium]MBW2125683.1 PilN domain-containing protein [Deltaproteobacteria bacterium]